MPDVQQVTEAMATANAVVPGKRLRLDFGDDGCIFLDGVDNRVTNDTDSAADTTVSVSFANFQKLADGSLNGTMAFMTGKIKIAGDMGAAMQLQSVTSKIGRA